MELITFVILLLYPDKFTFLDTIPPTAASPRRQLFFYDAPFLVKVCNLFPKNNGKTIPFSRFWFIFVARK